MAEVSKPEGYALGGLGLLQALLTALGAATGGLSAVFINETRWALGGVVLILVAGAWTVLALTRPRNAKGRTTGIQIGAALLVVGLVLTGYAAIVAPSLQAKPRIAVTLTAGRQITLEATVKMTGIKRHTIVHVEVNPLTETKRPARDGGVTYEYQIIAPVLYQAQVGPDSSGDVDLPLKLAVPSSGIDDVGVRAWTGPGGPPQCLNQATSASTVGCVVVRTKGLKSGR